jgi:hypothetical protein
MSESHSGRGKNIVRRQSRSMSVFRLTLPVCLVFMAAAPCLRAQEAAPVPFPDQSKSFCGVPFGATLDEARKTWQLEAADGASAPGDPVTLYLREEESHVLGGLVARELVYYFVNGKFYAVGFATPDNRQTTILREALVLGYGAQPHRDASENCWVWPGQTVSAQLIVNPSTGEGRVLLFSNELQADYEKSLREAAEKTASGLAGKGA